MVIKVLSSDTDEVCDTQRQHVSTTSQTLSTFRQRLKTWLFRKSYPDIII